MHEIRKTFLKTYGSDNQEIRNYIAAALFRFKRKLLQNEETSLTEFGI